LRNFTSSNQKNRKEIGRDSFGKFSWARGRRLGGPSVIFLALADAIVVIEDSVLMVTEAARTGKPVYVQALRGRSNWLSRFHRLMQERGATRPFQGKLDSWSYAPINDTEMVASTVRHALNLESKG
jgi:mitochondrial fission protein ELM1